MSNRSQAAADDIIKETAFEVLGVLAEAGESLKFKQLKDVTDREELGLAKALHWSLHRGYITSSCMLTDLSRMQDSPVFSIADSGRAALQEWLQSRRPQNLPTAYGVTSTLTRQEALRIAENAIDPMNDDSDGFGAGSASGKDIANAVFDALQLTWGWRAEPLAAGE